MSLNYQIIRSVDILNDLIITLPSTSTRNIIENIINKNAIERKIRILIDPSNTNGDANHPSLRGTRITLTRLFPVSPIENDLISTISKIIVITISKTNGTSLEVIKFFVKKSHV